MTDLFRCETCGLELPHAFRSTCLVRETCMDCHEWVLNCRACTDEAREDAAAEVAMDMERGA